MKKIILWMVKPGVSWKFSVFIGAALLLTGWFSGLNASEWASWVQAVGSIAAIVGSFALARYETRKADEAQKIKELSREVELAQAALGLGDDVEHALADVVKKMSNPRARGRTISKERLLQIQRALETFTQRELSPFLLKQVLALQREVAYSLGSIRELGVRAATEERRHYAECRLLAVKSCKHQINGHLGAYCEALIRHG